MFGDLMSKSFDEFLQLFTAYDATVNCIKGLAVSKVGDIDIKDIEIFNLGVKISRKFQLNCIDVAQLAVSGTPLELKELQEEKHLQELTHDVAYLLENKIKFSDNAKVGKYEIATELVSSVFKPLASATKEISLKL